MSKPGIVTAIPKRRYTLGEFSLVVLGEIESNDNRDYGYIMAVVRGTDPEPVSISPRSEAMKQAAMAMPCVW